MPDPLSLYIDQNEQNLDIKHINSLASLPTIEADATDEEIEQSFRAWKDCFITHLLHEGSVAESTIHHYSHDVELFFRYLFTHELHISRVEEVDTYTIRRFITHMQSVRCNGLASIQRRLASTNRFFQFLFDIGAIRANPLDDVPRGRYQEKDPVILTREEAARFLAASKTTQHPLRDHAIFQIFLGCGCTLSELLALNVGDFDREKGTLRLTGRDGFRRVVPLNSDCHKALSRYVESRPKAPADRALFLNRRGYRITKGAIYHAFRLILTRARIDKEGVTVQTLRHTCFTHMWESGTSVFKLQQIAGHASLSTTRRYTKSSRRRLVRRYTPRIRFRTRQPD